MWLTREQAKSKYPGVNFHGKIFYIGAGAHIREDAYIRAGAVIGEGAYIGAHAYIGEGAHIREGAYIEARAVIEEGAHIGEGATILSVCSKYTCNIIPFKNKEDEIRIGCVSYPLSVWESDQEHIARDNDYTWWVSTGKRIYEFLKTELEQYRKTYPK